VAIIATGDKVITPGTPMQDGKLYASNLVTQAGCNNIEAGSEIKVQQLFNKLI
jgi:molybdopterin biosynthesis enzyme